MKMNRLDDLYLDHLKSCIAQRNSLYRRCRRWPKAANSDDLRMGFQDHLEQTKTHVNRLEQIFASLGSSPGRKKCEAMEGLVKKGQKAIDCRQMFLRDVPYIAAPQRVEHYEIAAYGTVRTIANHLGHQDQSTLLQQTLDEEGATDKKLTAMAEGGIFSTGINEKAETASGKSSR